MHDRDGVGDKFEAPLERDEAEFGSLRVAKSPLLGLGSAGGEGSRNANDGAGNPDGEKIELGTEGGEDECCNFERALYVAGIMPPMLPRGRWRKGVD